MAAYAFTGTSTGVQELRIGRFIETIIAQDAPIRQEYLIEDIPSPYRTGDRHIRVGDNAYCISTLHWPRDLTGTEGRSNVPHWVAAASCACGKTENEMTPTMHARMTITDTVCSCVESV